MNKIKVNDKVNECELPIDVLKTGVEADLSSQKLRVEDAIIIAACINVSTSMKKIKVNECELPIDVLKTGVEVDLSGQDLRVEDAIIIAACINVNSSMKSLKYVIPPLFFSNLVGTGFPLERS